MITIMLTWLFGHVLVELSPIVILFLVLRLRKRADDPSPLDLLLGDGILFFFGLVLSVGLFTDLLKELLDGNHGLERYQVVQFLMLLVLLTIGCWTGYFFTQIRRSDGERASPWWSIAAAGFVVLLVAWIRLSFEIW